MVTRPLFERLNVLSSDDFELSCGATGLPPPLITWERNGRPLIDERVHFDQVAGQSKVMVTRAELEDSGSWTCVATNTAGSDRVAYEVEIIQPPVASLKDNTNVTTQIDNSFSLHCEVEARPVAQITWFHNGQEINQNDQRLALSRNKELLTVTGANDDDGGEWKCIAENHAGSISINFNLDIHSPPAIAASQKKHVPILITRGRQLRLDCRSTGNPTPTIVWTRNGMPIDHLDAVKYTLLNGGQVLEISSVSILDSSKFKCNARNLAGIDSISYTIEVHVPPTITKTGVTSQMTIEGESVVFRCPAQGVPAPLITWTLDGMPLTDGGHHVIQQAGRVLVVNGANRDDAGVYVCRAQNAAGHADQQYNLDVYIAPRIVSGSSTETVFQETIKNGQLELNCALDPAALPVPEVRWEKDGEVIESNEQYRIMSGRLFVRQVTSDAAGRYTCTATNKAGSDYRNYLVTVHNPPVFQDDEPVHKEVISSGSTTLTCHVTGGNPMPLHITWYKNGQLLLPSNRITFSRSNRKLYLVNIGVDDTGEYNCRAQNKAGMAEKAMTLNVLTPPEITATTSKQIWKDTDITTKLTCPTKGHPVPDITWYKLGHHLEDFFEMGEVEQSGDELVFFDIKPEYSGVYSCLARNRAGSDQFEFDVLVRQEPRVNVTGAQMISQGKILTLVCLIEQGNPKPTIQWKKDDAVIMPNAKTYISPDRTQLQVFSAQSADAGYYSCVADSTAGHHEHQHYVDVMKSPKLHDSYEEIEAIERDELELSCLTDIDPPPTVQWFIGDRQIKPDDYDYYDSFRGDNIDFYGQRKYSWSENDQVFHIYNIDRSDRHQYRCVMSNAAGTDSTTFNVDVLTAPEILGNDFDDEIMIRTAGDLVTLNCDASGTPPPEIEWLKDGARLFSQSGSIQLSSDARQLTLIDISPVFAGDYVCQVTNTAGQTERHFNLEVEIPPTAKMEEQFDAQEFENVVLHCQVTGQPVPQVMWFKNRKQIRPGETNGKYQVDGMKLIIRSITVQDQAVYQCQADNRAGLATADILLNVLQAPKIEGEWDNKVTTIELRTLELGCNTRQGNPIPTVRWFRNDYPLDVTPNLILSNHKRKLTIRRITKQDIGKYKCIVENDAGSDKKEFDVDVVVPPRIEADFAEYEAGLVGDQLELNCESSGYPTPEVSWMLNGEFLKANVNNGVFLRNNGQTLFINLLTDEWDGNLTCVAVNSAGEVSFSTMMEIFEAPYITNELNSPVIITEGDDLELECQSSGIPMPQISWKFNNEILDDIYPVVQGESLLFIPSVTVGDSGVYTCVALSVAGQARRDIMVTVYRAPTISAEEDAPGSSRDTPIVETPRGEKLELECYSDAVPTPTIRWFKDDRELALDSRHVFTQNNQVLTVLFLSESDTGLYTCISENEAGLAEKYWTVEIYVEPDLIWTPDELTSPLKGEYVNLECEATGNPEPVVSWFKDDELIEPGANRIALVDGNLSIQNVAESDNGIYECRAVNEAGEKRYQTVLAVNSAPTISIGSQKVTSLINERIELECDVSGYPLPVVEWTKNGHPLNEPDWISSYGHVLTLSAVTIDDNGNYACEARNEHGIERRVIELDIFMPPEIKVSTVVFSNFSNLLLQSQTKKNGLS